MTNCELSVDVLVSIEILADMPCTNSAFDAFYFSPAAYAQSNVWIDIMLFLHGCKSP